MLLHTAINVEVDRHCLQKVRRVRTYGLNLCIKRCDKREQYAAEPVDPIRPLENERWLLSQPVQSKTLDSRKPARSRPVEFTFTFSISTRHYLRNSPEVILFCISYTNMHSIQKHTCQLRMILPAQFHKLLHED